MVRKSLPDILQAVRVLRASGVRISNVTADNLAPLLPGTEADAIERLCAKFHGLNSLERRYQT